MAELKGWEQFEDQVCSLYRLLGFQVTSNINVAGQQVDLLCEKWVPGVGRLVLCVECKHARPENDANSVSNEAIQSFASMFRSSRDTQGWSAGIVVSNRPFSQSARAAAAQHHDIHLKTLDDLYEELLQLKAYLQKCVSDIEDRDHFSDYIPLNARRLSHTLDRTEHVTTAKAIFDSWIDNNHSKQLCILGDFGSGKSTFLKYMPKQWVINLRNSGVKAVSVNTYICAMNAYWKWAGEATHLAYLKEEQKILATFTAEQVRRLLAFKPSGRNQKRCHALVCLLLDTGLRIDEACKLMPANLDFDNLLVTVMGKGRKERKVPLSSEGRKILYRYIRETPNRFVFGTRNQTMCSIRNLQRDFRAICKKLLISGVRCSPHTLRHTFAVSYLRAGGNLFYLSKILGHTSVKTTERYLQSLGVEDLQAVHNGLLAIIRERSFLDFGRTGVVDDTAQLEA